MKVMTRNKKAEIREILDDIRLGLIEDTDEALDKIIKCIKK